VKLGIIAALPAEASCLAIQNDRKNSIFIAARSTPQQISDNVCLMISGIGDEQARKAADTLISHGADALLSWGCAGALSAELQCGDLLLPGSITMQEKDAVSIDPQWHARLYRVLSDNYHPCTDALAASAGIITTPAQKLALHQASGAVAVDMESAAIGMVARNAHIPFIVIRAIVDDVDTTIPACINKAMDEYGVINHAGMLRLLLHPLSWLRLIRLRRQFKATKSTLSLVAGTTGLDFLAFSSHSGV